MAAEAPALRIPDRVWPNRRSGRCTAFLSGCEAYVDAGGGGVVGNPQNKVYKLYCPECLRAQGFSVPGGEHIEVRPCGAGRLAFQRRRQLSDERYFFLDDRLKESGATYDKVNGAHLVPRERADVLIGALREKGFDVKVVYEASLMLEAEAQRKVLDAQAAKERVEETLEGRLAKRGLSLWPFQVKGIEWLAPKERAMLCDEQGLGKTVQALLALPSVDKKIGRVASPVIVVCTGVGKGVWDDECRRWRPDLKPVVLDGRDSFRWPSVGEVIVMNYDILPPVEDLQGPPPGLILVGDEAQNVKNPKAQRTVRFRALGDLARQVGGRSWVLTGTPLMNKLSELWALAQAAGLGTEAFGTYKQFKEMCGCTEELHPCDNCGHMMRHKKLEDGTYKCMKKGGCEKKCTQKQPTHTVWGSPSAEVAARFQRIALRRLRSEVLPDLPGKTWQDHKIKLAREFSRKIDSELPPGWEAALVQAIEDAGGVDFQTMSSARRVLAEAKVAAMLEFVESYEDADEPLIVFSCHKAPLAVFAERDGWAILDGETGAKDKRAIPEAFQSGQLRGLACNVKTAGQSITLTRASHALFVDEAWSPSENEQAEDRLARIGQKRAVLIHRLRSDHALDERVCELLDKKRQLIKEALGKASSGSETAAAVVSVDSRGGGV